MKHLFAAMVVIFSGSALAEYQCNVTRPEGFNYDCPFVCGTYECQGSEGNKFPFYVKIEILNGNTHFRTSFKNDFESGISFLVTNTAIPYGGDLNMTLTTSCSEKQLTAKFSENGNIFDEINFKMTDPQSRPSDVVITETRSGQSHSIQCSWKDF